MSYPDEPGTEPPVPPEHPQAITALILGVLSIFCSVTGPFAWSIGRRAVAEIDASGGRIGGRARAQAGYILGVIGTAILVTLAILLVLLLLTGTFAVSTAGSS